MRIEIRFLGGAEEAGADPAFLDASRISDANAGGGDEVLGDVARKGKGYSNSHDYEVD